jgi:uncharacterized protein DUF4349/putative zinc finger protein
MSKNNHPIENEELMAYLDGELATDRAVEAAAHLEHCQECQELAADLRRLSQQMMAWEVEPSETAEISAEIEAALKKPKKNLSKRSKTAGWSWGMLFIPSRIAWAGGGAVFLLLMMAIFFVPNQPRSNMSALKSAQMRREQVALIPHSQVQGKDDAYTDSSESFTAPDNRSTNGSLKNGNEPVTSFYMSSGSTDGMDETRSVLPPPPPPPPLSAGKSRSTLDDSQSASDFPTVPMIARVAGLTLTTKEFDKARGSMEEILKRHGGYMGELQMSAPADAGRTLTATLRIPASQLDAAMAELKKLGRVKGESQGGEEVTQQYVDLEARLANGKHTEQRLTEILIQRTGKLQDVLKVELEIDRVRGEIEQMDAEKKELSKRVAFATLNTTIQEEYQAKLRATPPSTESRFRNAGVDGYNTVVEGLISVGLFLLSAGPSLLLWAAILFLPARWAWRKVKANLKQNHESTKEGEAK